MESVNLFYDKSDFKIGNNKYFMYLCEGQRGRGKTTFWLNECVKHYEETGKRFVYLRRSEVELKLALKMGLFNGVKSAHKEFAEKYPIEEEKAGNIILKDKDCNEHKVGYYMDLNNVKGISIEDCDVVLFDEFVAQKRSAYKGGESGLHEPDLLFRLLETIFRRRKFHVVMLGNKDTPSNPYVEYFRIPFGSTLYKDKSRGIFYEYDYSEDTAKDKEQTTLGVITKGTSYNDYSMGLKSLNEIDESLIEEKPSHAELIYNIKIFGQVLTIWAENNSAILYVSDKYKINNTVRTISVSNSDMSINTDFIKYSGQFIALMGLSYGGGSVRFNSQKTASLFLAMLSLNV